MQAELLEDPPLTLLGRRQMKRVAKWLLDEPEPVHWILTSSLLRAQQSAALIAEAVGIEPETWDDLREHEVGIETSSDVFFRAQQVAQRIHQRFSARENNNIVVVTHAGFSALLVSALIGAPKHTRFSHFNAAITLLEWDMYDVVRVRYANFVGHLSKEMIT